MSGQRQPIELVSAKSSKYFKKKDRGEKKLRCQTYY